MLLRKLEINTDIWGYKTLERIGLRHLTKQDSRYISKESIKDTHNP